MQIARAKSMLQRSDMTTPYRYPAPDRAATAVITPATMRGIILATSWQSSMKIDVF